LRLPQLYASDVNNNLYALPNKGLDTTATSTNLGSDITSAYQMALWDG